MPLTALSYDEQDKARYPVTTTGPALPYIQSSVNTSRGSRAPTPITQVDLPDFSGFGHGYSGRYHQSTVNADRTTQGRPVLPQPLTRGTPQTPSALPVRGGKTLGSEKPPISSLQKPMAQLSEPSDFIRNPSVSTGLEKSVTGILPPNSSLLNPTASLSPMVYERSNIYGNQGITRFDDASGVPTFTNMGRAGYDELQGRGRALPGQASQVAGLNAPGGSGLSDTGVADLMVGTRNRDALNRARNAAAARGDHDAVARSYRTPEEQMAYDQQKALTGITKSVFNTVQTRGLPAKSLAPLLTALNGTLPDGKSSVYAAQTQKELALAQKAQAEAAGTDPRASLYAAQAEGAHLDNRAKQHLQSLHQQLLQPDLTPEVRKQITDMILAISGKVQNPQQRYRAISVPGGKDEYGADLPHQALMYDTIEGQYTQGALPGAPAQPGLTQVGTHKGKPVYQDAQGNRFIDE